MHDKEDCTIQRMAFAAIFEEVRRREKRVCTWVEGRASGRATWARAKCPSHKNLRDQPHRNHHHGTAHEEQKPRSTVWNLEKFLPIHNNDGTTSQSMAWRTHLAFVAQSKWDRYPRWRGCGFRSIVSRRKNPGQQSQSHHPVRLFVSSLHRPTAVPPCRNSFLARCG
jgi:hypothetical protein